jgi:uncharacterized protein
VGVRNDRCGDASYQRPPDSAVGWTVTGLLTIIVVGFLLFPVMIVATLVPFVHMGYAAYKVNQGVDYRYPLVADLVEGNRRLRA